MKKSSKKFAFFWFFVYNFSVLLFISSLKMEGNNPVEWLDIESNNNEKIFSNIDNFLVNVKNKQLLLDVLDDESNNDLKNAFEEFLGNLNPKKKILLKKDLDECTNKDEILNVIIENVYNNEGYSTWNNLVISIDAEQETLQNEQETVQNEQETLQNEQETVQNEQQTVQNEQQTVQNEQETVQNEQQTVQNEQQTVQNEQQTVQNEQQVIIQWQKATIENQGTTENSQETQENISWLEEINSAIEARLSLMRKYEWLDEKTNQNSELYQAIKSEFEEKWVIKQLKESNHDDEFISNYILVHATLHEMESNPDTYHDDISRFDEIVKNLDNACDIPDTKLDDFSSKNVNQTRKELFNESVWNKALIDRKATNIKEHEKEYDEIFESMDEAKMIKWYWKFIEDDNLKDIFIRYSKNKNRISSDEYSQLIAWIEKIKPDIDKNIKERVEEMCIISQVKWLTSCVWRNFGDSFQFNKANNIVDNEWVISINGNIDWINFSLRHDTNDAEARLQTTSILNKTENSFSIGQNYIDSPFKLPNKDQIFDVARTCIDDNIADDFKNLDEYLQVLQDDIDKKVSNKLYKNVKFTNHYMTNKIEWEKIANKTIDLMQNIKWSAIGKEIENTNQNVFNFVDLVDFNIKNSTVNKKEKIYKCISKIQWIVSDYWNSDNVPTGKYPEIINHFVADKNCINETQKILNWYQSGWESLFDLLNHYTSNSPLNEWKLKIINFNDLDKDLSGIQWDLSNSARIWEENESKKLADNILEKQLSQI